MFKDAKDYTSEELLRACQGFFGGLYWAWYSTAVKIAGEQKANEMLVQLADSFAEVEAAYMHELWGGKFKSLQEITRALDVVHRMVAYEGTVRGSTPVWQMEDENKGYEQISHCPIHATTPPELQGKGPTALCMVYCHNIGQKFYARMGCTIQQDSWMPKGASYCGFRIERNLVQIAPGRGNQ